MGTWRIAFTVTIVLVSNILLPVWLFQSLEFQVLGYRHLIPGNLVSKTSLIFFLMPIFVKDVAE
jgi:hypothetical protein